MLHDLTLTAPMLLVLLGAMFTLLVDPFLGEGGKRDPDGPARHFWGHLGAVISFAALAAALALWWTGPHEMQTVAFSTHLSASNFSLFFVGLIAVCTALTLLASPRYLEAHGIAFGEYYALVLFAAFGMMIMVSAESMLTLFVGLETMSLAVYVLAAFKRRSLASVEAGMKYFIMGAVASALLLYGMAFVYGLAGGTSYVEIGRAMAGELAGPRVYLSLAIVMTLAAFLFKVAAVPFHMWTPDAYEGAPTPVTGFMASGVKVAAFGALLKFLYVAAAGAGMEKLPIELPTLLAWIAVITMTVGNLLALPQTNVKRVLAYSAVAHAGYLLLGCVAMSADPNLTGYGLPGGAVPFYLVGYALASLAAFAALSTVGRGGQELTRESELAGLGWRYPFAGAVLALAMFSLAGVPPTLGFFGKLSLIQGVLSVEEGRYLPFIIVMILNSVVSAYYYLRVTVYVYMRPATDDQPEPLRSSGLTWAMALAAGAIVAIGVLPGRTMSAAGRAGAGVRTAAVTAHIQHKLRPQEGTMAASVERAAKLARAGK